MKTLVLSSLLGLILCLHNVSALIDRTQEEKATGEDVVDVAVARAQSIFGYDYKFLKRVAYVESQYGENPTTFRANFTGGIWQLAQVYYNATVQDTPSLRPYKTNITAQFSVTWNTTTWNDLLKPLHSVLATRLYLATKPAIPTSLKAQAAYWNTHLNRNDSLNATYFVDIIEKLENATIVPCNAKMDLVLVLDGSGSIGASNFDLVRTFSAGLFASYSLDNVRMGLITYSSGNTTEIELQNNLTAAQIANKVSSIKYPQGGTNTNLGIQQAILMFNRTIPRPGVPKVMVLFTDGQANEGGIPGDFLPNITDAEKAGIESFSVGVGGYTLSELLRIAYNYPERVFTLDDFEALKNFFNTLNKETCEAPAIPQYNQTIIESVVQYEKRNYKFSTIPNEGFTVHLSIQSGSVAGYWSYGNNTLKPNSALHDGQLPGGSNYIPNPWGNSSVISSKWSSRAEEDERSVFISLVGIESNNNFTVTAEVGNRTSGAGSIVFAPVLIILAFITTRWL